MKLVVTHGPNRDPEGRLTMTFDLNWTERESKRSVTHTGLTLTISQPNPAIDERKLYEELREFIYFNGGHNDVALVSTLHHDGVRYAVFDMLGISGWLARQINRHVVHVRIWCNATLREIVGDTVGRHMLIGQRRWTLTRVGAAVCVRTEAYERARGFLNWVGLWTLGRAAQSEVWTSYLANIRDHVAKRNSAIGAIQQDASTTTDGNPWTPQTPYPGCPNA